MNTLQFWQENRNGSRVPLALMFESLFLFGVLPDTDTRRYYTDLGYRHFCDKRFNTLAEEEIGIRPFNEQKLSFMKGAFEVRLGGEQIVNDGETAWIHPAVHSKEELAAWIERTAEMDLRKDPVPEEWIMDSEAFTRETGVPVSFLPSITGPVTVAASLIGTTELCMWSMDEPGLMADFFEILCEKQIEYIEGNQLRESGSVSRGWMAINDDSCCLFSPALYEKYIVPYLEKLFNTFAPGPGDKRRQHSDSAMGHLMPLLRELGVNEVNLGPSLHPSEIREALPDAVIHGQMPPNILRNGTEAEIRGTVQRDFEALGYYNFVECTSGVTSAGTPWENIRMYMRAVEELTAQ